LWQSQGEPVRCEYLKRLWYDSVSGNVGALREEFGADRLVLGTDFPHLAGERFNQCVSKIEESDLSPEKKRGYSRPQRSGTAWT
jgi:aminocarboxymuconate-semialdehyde decarboxylase